MGEPSENEEDEVVTAYKVWRVDCPCGSLIDYGEDESSVPEKCEECGVKVEVGSG
jgi:hypothetical protein